MLFDDLPPKAQRLITVQRSRIDQIEDPAEAAELQRELILTLVSDLITSGTSARDACEVVVGMFDVLDPELAEALNVTRGVQA